MGIILFYQLEDVIDCVKVTLGTTYDYVFLFDSSSGHAKKRSDGLDVKAMNVKWHFESFWYKDCENRRSRRLPWATL